MGSKFLRKPEFSTTTLLFVTAALHCLFMDRENINETLQGHQFTTKEQFGYLCLKLTTLKLISGVYMNMKQDHHSPPKAAASQALTFATLSLMDPSHCSAAPQSPEGTLLLVMQSSQYAVFSKCFSGLTSG